MDKMAESANLVSLINTNKTENGSRTKTKTVEGDSFSTILEKKTGQSADTAEKTRNTITGDSGDKQADKAKEKTQQQADLEERLKAKLSLKPGDMSMANYLYNISLRSPDSMSVSEKQSFHVGEFSNEAMGVKDFQKMLSERGINLRDLTMTQLAQLTQRTNRAQITSFLDNLLSKIRDEKQPVAQQAQNVNPAENTTETKKEEGERKTVEARSGEMRQPEQPSGNPVSLNLVHDSQRPQTTENQSRKEEREKVIQQIIEHMEIQTVGRKTELTMKLNPEYLGDMRVKLSSENGKLEAQFETTSREVREFIEEGWQGLKDTFTRKGLNLAKVSATVVDALT